LAKAIAADFIFDGEAVHPHSALVIDGEEIVALLPRAHLSAALPVEELPARAWLAPGFIDIQVNGGGDVLFNDAPTPETIATIAAAHRRFGTTSLLPTLVSDSAEKMRQARAAVDAAMATMPGVVGIHFEGPFLSPERVGAHDLAVLRRPTPDDLAFLTTRHAGVTLVTLAPEQVPDGFIAQLVEAGVVVSLGHTMATYTQTRAALAEGATGFTHLFNAMRPMAAREPGPIAAALEEPGTFYGLIADGEHVAPAMLRLALRGAGQAMLVTDAMPHVLRLAAAAPADFLGLGNRLGRLKPGYRADLVALDPQQIRVLATWVAGEAARAGAN
jgi:N-acetylglucosamine-6-phosphate deacetylase